VGESERALREVFKKEKEPPRGHLFFDTIDSIAPGS